MSEDTNSVNAPQRMAERWWVGAVQLLDPRQVRKRFRAISRRHARASAPATVCDASTQLEELVGPADPKVHPDDTENVTAEDPVGDIGGKSAESSTDDDVAARLRRVLMLGLVTVAALAALSGWLGFRTYDAVRDQRQHELLLEAGRRGAEKLTTVSYTEVDADVKRILDSATGTFFDDFQKRSQPFVDMVKQVQSKTVGTVTEAGLQSVEADHAQVLVTVSVKTSLAGAESQPRLWRMRISVQKVDREAKVSNVEFVP